MNRRVLTAILTPEALVELLGLPADADLVDVRLNLPLYRVEVTVAHPAAEAVPSGVEPMSLPLETVAARLGR